LQLETLVEDLQKEFIRRKSRNPSFSMRAFSRTLRISSGALSEILNGKRIPGRKTYLQLSAQMPSFTDLHTETPQEPFSVLREDELALIKDWYHFAIMDLLRTRDFPGTVDSIAESLKVNVVAIRLALSRLARLGLVAEKNKKWTTLNYNVTSPPDVPSSTIKEAFKGDLEMAANALDDQSVKNRDFSTITLCFDSEQMVEAKTLIKKFRREFNKKFNRTGGDSVYQLSMQFFALANTEGEV
jgi:uncharacterized protein (TIGR02147 family)